jgi:hypothetical protein
MTSNDNLNPTSSFKGTPVTITNNLKVSIDIYDVFNPSTSAQTLPFVYTKLGTIAAGSSSTVTTIRNVTLLEAMYTGIISELDNKYYYQFPIKFMSGTQLTYGTPKPLAYSIEEADRLANIQSFLFHKFAMANPGSALTTSLNTAIKTGKSDDINKFFVNTKNFKNCTLASWNAVMTWLQQFTSGWQGPYYLYQKAPNPIPSGYIPNLMGTLNILSDAQNNKATLNICSADAKGNPVYANPPQTTTVVMAGDGTMVDANPGADVAITLTPVWMNVVQTTMQNGVPVASYLIGSAVCGTMAGTEVVSSQTARQIPGKPADPKKAGFFDSLFNSASSTLSTLVGLIMLYEFISKAFNKAQTEKETAKSEATSDADLQSRESLADSDMTFNISIELSSSSSTSTFDTASEVMDGYKQSSDAMLKETMEQSMEEQVDRINNEISDQLNEGGTPTPEFEDAFEQMQTEFTEAQNSIDSGDFEAANTKITDATSGIESAISEYGSEMADWESASLNESADALKETTETTEALDKSQEDFENDRANESEDSGFDAEDVTPEVDPIEL